MWNSIIFVQSYVPPPCNNHTCVHALKCHNTKQHPLKLGRGWDSGVIKMSRNWLIFTKHLEYDLGLMHCLKHRCICGIPHSRARVTQMAFYQMVKTQWIIWDVYSGQLMHFCVFEILYVNCSDFNVRAILHDHLLYVRIW